MTKSTKTKVNRSADSTISASKMTVGEVRLLKRVAKQRRLDPATADAELVKGLLKRGAIETEATMLVVSHAGKQALRRIKLAQDEEQIYSAQHQDRQTAVLSNNNADRKESNKGASCRKNDRLHKASRTKVNRAESPLAVLASKKRSDGSPYLAPSQCEAGERLRAEFERGKLAPSMGINWDRLGEAVGSVSKNARIQQSGNSLSDTALSAQQRFRNAVEYVGEEFAGALIDFCCFMKGLEEIERTHRWPARSAKQILALALSRLARHYGFSDTASGPTQGAMRHWGADGYRPTLSNPD